MMILNNLKLIILNKNSRFFNYFIAILLKVKKMIFAIISLKPIE